MRFNCKNCNKAYEIAPSLLNNGVRFTCRKCNQQMTLKASSDQEVSVVASGPSGDKVHSTTQEVSKVTKGRLYTITTPNKLHRDKDPAWHVNILGRKYGPLTNTRLLEALVKNKISPSTYAWRKSMKEWVRIENIPEMNHILEMAVEQNPNIRSRMDEKSHLSAVTRKSTAQISENTREIRRKKIKSPAPSPVDELYNGPESSAIEPRNWTQIQFEDEPVEDEEGPRQKIERAPTIRDTPRAAWETEIRDTIQQAGTRGGEHKNGKLRDTQPMNLALFHRERRTTRIVIIAAAAIVAITCGVAAFILIRHSLNNPDAGRATADSTATVQPPAQSETHKNPAKSVPEGTAGHKVPAATGNVIVLESAKMEQEGLKKYITSQIPEFSKCRARLNRQTDASISVHITFILGSDGHTTDVLARPEGFDEPRMANCIENRIKSWTFAPRASSLKYIDTISI